MASMDDNQVSSPFASSYPDYGIDVDMMKRQIENASNPEAKKRWSPNGNGPNAAGTPTRDAFGNYAYGSQSVNNGGFNNSPLYSTPALPLAGGNGNGAAAQQMTPTTAAAFLAQQQQMHAQAQANGFQNFAGYNMLGMGIPGMSMLYNNQMANLGQAQNRVPSLNLQIPTSTSPNTAPYSPVALSAALSATAANATARTVYIGNLPATASVDELLNLVHFGPLENVRVLPEKSCVFLSFLDGATAAAFHADATVKKLSLHGQELKIGWGKPSPVPAQVALAISQSNASRNVYLGGLDESTTEEQLRDDLSRFGLIDQVKIVRDKNIGFVHFLSISTATKVVAALPTEPAWAGKRVNFGKDRCAYVPKSQQAAAHQAQAAAAQSILASSAASLASPLGAVPFSPFSPFAQFSPADALGGLGGAQALNRTVYLGNIHPETTTEDMCNAIRGGVLQSIRYMADKHIAFVTFVDPAAAFTFFQVASFQGLTLNNRRLKIGWGKNSGPLPPTLALAVHAGATRNVYLGNIEDFETFSEEKLKKDFSEYGEIELVNFLKEKNCAFVNYTNIANAIKAIEGIKEKPEYSGLRIAHGKDRCANPPRSGPQGSSGGRRSAGAGVGGHGPPSAEPKENGEDGDMDDETIARIAEEAQASPVVKSEDVAA